MIIITTCCHFNSCSRCITHAHDILQWNGF